MHCVHLVSHGLKTRLFTSLFVTRRGAHRRVHLVCTLCSCGTRCSAARCDYADFLRPFSPLFLDGCLTFFAAQTV